MQAPRVMLWFACAILASGCFGGPGGGRDARAPDVQAWTLPVWEVGDFWAYEGPGLYERFEVVGRETLDGEDAYRLDFAGEDTGSVETGTFWISAVDLGTLGYESSSGLTIRERCPGIFPLENRTGACRVDVNGSPAGQSTRHVAFDPPSRVATPAGTFDAVRYWYDDGDGSHIFSGWYADEVGFWAQKEVEPGRVARLVEWSASRA